MVKLVRRAGPEVIDQLNVALLGNLAGDKLLRGRKLRVDTTVVEADIDYQTDADLVEHAVRKLGGLVRRVKGRGAVSRTRFCDRGRAAGRRMKQLARTLRRWTGVAMGEVDRLTGQVAKIARHTLREVRWWRVPPGVRGGVDLTTAVWVGWSTTWPRRSPRPSGCWPRPTSGCPATE